MNFRKLNKIILGAFYVAFIMFFSFNYAFSFDATAIQNRIVSDDGAQMNSNVSKFVQIVAEYETRDRNIPVDWSLSKSSTAAGYYQFTETTLFGEAPKLDGGIRGYMISKYGIDPFPNAFRNGLENCSNSSCERKERAIMKLSKSEQQALVMAMWDQKGADFSKVADADADEMFKIYRYYHHGVRTSTEKKRRNDLRNTAPFAEKIKKAFGESPNDNETTTNTDGCSQFYSHEYLHRNSGLNTNPRVNVREESAIKLDKMTLYLRQIYGDDFKMQINSITGGGHAHGSQHYNGRAFDIQISPAGTRDPERQSNFYTAAKLAGFTSFGFGRSYIHVDDRSGAKHWFYNDQESHGRYNYNPSLFSSITYTPSDNCSESETKPPGEEEETTSLGENESLQEAADRLCNDRNGGGIVNYDGPLCGGDEKPFVSFIVLIKRVLVYLQGLGIIAATVNIMYVGYLLLAQPEKEAAISKAKDILKNIAIGLFFMFAAWLIVNIITTGLGSNTLDLLND